MSDEPKSEMGSEEKNTETPEAVEDSKNDSQPESELDALIEENATLKDRLLRAVAEMENLRKRSERERTDAGKYAISSFARDMLVVGDNLARALETIQGHGADKAQEDIAHLIEGVEMTQREMLNIFERHGIKKLEPQGERFDPNLHQAMFEVPDPSVPNGTVAQVVQAGYVIAGRVLRPAMVGVAKGGPAAPKDNPKDEEVPAAAEKPAAEKPSGEEALGVNLDKSA